MLAVSSVDQESTAARLHAEARLAERRNAVAAAVEVAMAALRDDPGRWDVMTEEEERAFARSVVRGAELCYGAAEANAPEVVP